MLKNYCNAPICYTCKLLTYSSQMMLSKLQFRGPFRPITRIKQLSRRNQIGIPKPSKAPRWEARSRLGQLSELPCVTAKPHDTDEFVGRCPICQEQFGMENIVVLSCGHSVHVTCLMSFRRFTRAKEHMCPVCRQQYEFVELKPETEHFNRCALTIQRVFRGYCVRRRMQEFVTAGSPLHRRWIFSRAERASTKLASAIEDQSDAVDAILANIDKELDWARNIMKAVEIQEHEVDWQKIRDNIKSKGCGTCPICLRDIATSDCSVTSCSHTFHTQCLNAWAQFCRKAKNTPTCPCCRSVFQCRPLAPAPSMPKLDSRFHCCL